MELGAGLGGDEVVAGDLLGTTMDGQVGSVGEKELEHVLLGEALLARSEFGEDVVGGGIGPGLHVEALGLDPGGTPEQLEFGYAIRVLDDVGHGDARDGNAGEVGRIREGEAAVICSVRADGGDVVNEGRGGRG